MKLKDVKQPDFDCVHCGKVFKNAKQRQNHEDNLQYVCPAWKDKPGARTDLMTGHFVVYFDVPDSHLNGSAVVNARNQTEAKNVVRMSTHYKVTSAEPLQTYFDEMAMWDSAEDFWNEVEDGRPAPGEYSMLEVGS